MRPRVTSRDLARPREAIFSLLADPQTYPRWVAGLEAVRPLLSEGDVSVISVDWPALADTPQVLELVRAPPVSVVFREIEHDGRIAGRWDLTELPGGRRTRLRGQLALRVGWLDPRRRRLKRLLEESLDGLEHLCEGDGPSSPGEILLEIVRQGDGLLVSWRGERHALHRRSDTAEDGEPRGRDS